MTGWVIAGVLYAIGALAAARWAAEVRARARGRVVVFACLWPLAVLYGTADDLVRRYWIRTY